MSMNFDRSSAKSGFIKTLTIGFALGVVFCVGWAMGTGSDWLLGQNENLAANNDVGNTLVEGQDLDQLLTNRQQLPNQLQEMMLRADTAAATNSMAMATGRVDENVEGLFVLDFLTGDLFCWVVSPRGWIAEFKTNVIAEFGGLDKRDAAEFIMTTGYISAARGGGAAQPASTVCYVADVKTGKVAAFSFSWNKNLARSGGMQSDRLVKIAEAATRASIERN